MDKSTISLILPWGSESFLMVERLQVKPWPFAFHMFPHIKKHIIGFRTEQASEFFHSEVILKTFHRIKQGEG